MGLFIHTPIQAINKQRKLLELERQAEIASGLMYLQQMVESDPNYQPTEENLKAFARLLKFVPEHQRANGIEALFMNLLDKHDSIEQQQQFEQGFQKLTEDSNQLTDDQGASEAEGNLSSDYELDYRIRIHRSQKQDVEIAKSRAIGQAPPKKEVDPLIAIQKSIENEWQVIQPILAEKNKRTYIALSLFIHKSQKKLPEHTSHLRIEEAKILLSSLDKEAIKKI
jgi:hypothetical protein